ncbi:MAG TPA: MDR family MFS transporter [Candidatus Limnocylindria bacterium]|nr:MDR family MFS transporter [Candidatus Limnocylindria bacterium]
MTSPAPTTLSPLDDAPVHVDRRTKFEILFAVMLGLFLSALDQTIVATALPKILTDLSGNDLYTWVVTVYLLTSTVTGPLYGKLSDLFGRRPMLMLGIGLFLVGSLLSGLSQEMWQLILFRGIQGLGAGALFPISLAVIGDLFSPRERGRYQGLFGAVFGVSMLIGPGLGGFLADQVSWHWVFFVNLPIGLLALFVIWRLMPHIRHPERAISIDYVGAAVFTAAVVPLLLGLTNKQTADWTDPSVGGLLLLSGVLVAAFVWIESRVADPILHLDLFRNRTFVVSVLATGLVSFGFFGGIIFIPRWFQFVLGSSATESGYQIMPMLIGLIFSSIASGQIVSRTGRYKWILAGSLAVSSIGLYLMTGLRADTPQTTLWIWMAIMGLGIGPSFAVFTLVVQNAVQFRMMGVATSALTFFRQIGGSVGLAIAGTVLGSTLVEETPRQMLAAGVPQPLVDQFASAPGLSGGTLTNVGVDLGAQILREVPAQFRAMVEPFIANIVAGIHEAFSIALGASLWLGVAAAVVATGVTIVGLPELALRHSMGEATEGTDGRAAHPAPVMATD